MYEAFHGLREPPFRLTPDPHYLYLSRHHREALGHLLFGIQEGSGFVAVTGEIGAGKTTLLRALIRDLDPTTVVAYVFNPALSDLELLQTINAEFGLPAGSTSKHTLIGDLNRFLVQEKHAGKRVVVIVDEAQNLSPAVLEQLRLLSNLETETEKLLQIVLVGQPELRELLGRSELEQLNQRITIRWHLPPLDRSETAAYVRHRLRIAGAAAGIFSPGALRLLHRYSRGVPRLVNIGAHRALLIAYTQDRHAVGSRIMLRAIRELQRHDGGAGWRWRRLRPALTGTLAACGLALAVAVALGPPRALAPSATTQAARAPASSQSEHDAAVAPGVHLALAVGPAASGATPSGAASERAAASAVGTLAPPVATTEVVPATPGTGSAPRAEAVSDASRFWSAIMGTSQRAAAAIATDDLLATWGAEPLRPDERAAPVVNLDDVTVRRHLRYLPTSGTLARLQLLNVPAILELLVPASRERRFAVLLQLDATGAVLRHSEFEVRLTTDELAGAWHGDAHLFWRDFEELPLYLAPGSNGPDVERLQRLLAETGEYQGTPSATYDPPTAEAIARFQRSRRLVPDGIVGPLTKIVLYDAVARYAHPRLGGDT